MSDTFDLISTNEYVGNGLLFVGGLVIALAIPSPITRETALGLGALGVLICLFGLYWRMDTAGRHRMRAYLRSKLGLAQQDDGEDSLKEEYEKKLAEAQRHPGNPMWVGIYTQGLVPRYPNKKSAKVARQKGHISGDQENMLDARFDWLAGDDTIIFPY